MIDFRFFTPSSEFWDVLGNISAFAQALFLIVGAPFGYMGYLRRKEKELGEQETFTFKEADNAYRDYLKFCLEHPRLDVFDFPNEFASDLTPEERKQEVIALTMLISIFELAFLSYKKLRDRKNCTYAQQWLGWEAYIIRYFGRLNFQNAWDAQHSEFDQSFVAEMEKLRDRKPLEYRRESNDVV